MAPHSSSRLESTALLPPDILTFDNDDPYETQIARLIEGSPTCTYREALDTYALTWAIRLAGEKERGGGGGCGAQCR